MGASRTIELLSRYSSRNDVNEMEIYSQDYTDIDHERYVPPLLRFFFFLVLRRKLESIDRFKSYDLQQFLNKILFIVYQKLKQPSCSY